MRFDQSFTRNSKWDLRDSNPEPSDYESPTEAEYRAPKTLHSIDANRCFLKNCVLTYARIL